MGFPGGSDGKESSCNAGDLGLIPGLGRFPGEGNSYPLQYSGLEKCMNCIVHGVAKSWTQRVGHTWATFALTHWKKINQYLLPQLLGKKWHNHFVFLITRDSFLLGPSQVILVVNNPPAIWETWVWSLDWEDPVEKGTVTHSSILSCRIPWTEKPGRLQSMGFQRVRHDWVTFTLTHSLHPWVTPRQPIPSLEMKASIFEQAETLTLFL